MAGFGTSATSSTGFNLNKSGTAASGLAFGLSTNNLTKSMSSGFNTATTQIPSLTQTNTKSTGFSLTGLTPATSASTSGTASSIGFSTATTQVPSLTQTNTKSTGFSLTGLTPATSASTSGSFGGSLFGAKTPAPSGGVNFGLGTSKSTSSITGTSTQSINALTSTPSTKGLGGVDLTSSSSLNGNGSKYSIVSQSAKDQAVIEEICKDVKAFEQYVAKQKDESNQVSRFSVRSLHKMNAEIGSLSVAVDTIASAVQINKAMVEKLRSAFVKQLSHAEMAQRTHNTPLNLQHDNIAPIKYFTDLVVDFGATIQLYRQQIDELENHLHSLSNTILTPQDISVALVKTQDTFVTLASNLHSVHDNVKRLKEQYLAYRRVVRGGDRTDIFATNQQSEEPSGTHAVRKIQGPAPFENLSNVATLAMASLLQQPQHAPPQQSFMKPSYGLPGSSNLFGTTNTASGGLFGSKPAAASNLFGGTTTSAGSTFTGFGSSSTLKPSLSAGFNKTTSGNVFFGNTSFNSSAGVTFGGTAARPNTMELKLPPNNKRNKK